MSTITVDQIHENPKYSQSQSCQDDNVEVETIFIFDKSDICPVDIVPVGNVEDEDTVRIGVTTNQDGDQRNAVEDEIPDMVDTLLCTGLGSSLSSSFQILTSRLVSLIQPWEAASSPVITKPSSSVQ